MMNNNDKTKSVKNTEKEYPLEIIDDKPGKETDQKDKGITNEIMTRRKRRSKQPSMTLMEKKALKLLSEMESLPVSSEETEQLKAVVGEKQLAAFLIGTSWPEMSYEKIAGLVGCTSRTIYNWREDAGFQKEVKRYGEEYIEREWLPLVRAQVRMAKRGNTEAFNALARVLGKGTTKVDITAHTPEMKRLEGMTDEELEIHIAELRATKEGK